MKILRIAGWTLAALLLLAAGVVVYLLAPDGVPETSDYTIDRGALEAAAGSVAGEPPVRVNHVRVAEAEMPRAALFSGFDFSPHRMVHGAYQLVYADGSYVLIDSGFGRPVHEQMAARGEARYDDANAAALAEALPRARRIVITHEHPDHIQGLAEAPDAGALAPRVFLNRAQHESPGTASVLSDALLDAISPVDVAGAVAIAPGVAVWPAAGHTPGSQLVFVRLEDGRRFLFIGDVAWHLDGIRELAYRPRLVTDLLLGEDRDAVKAQFRTLKPMLDDPDLLVVASHDLDQLEDLQGRGVLGDGLETP